MRRGGALVLVLLCVGLGGCLAGDPARPSTWLDNLKSARTALGPDCVLIDFVLVERPLGDPFLNDELWKSTDSQVAGLERQGVLDDNGFCVGQVIGMTPAKLQHLLNCERYDVSRRRQILTAGGTTSVALGPTQPECRFRLKIGEAGTDVSLEQSQCTLVIEPSLVRDGRTKLRFTPEVLYGSMLPDYQVATDGSGWVLDFKRARKAYPALSWEVTLGPNQFLVIGTRFDENAAEDAPQTLGSQCFIQQTDRTFVQRLLVVRTMRGESSSTPGSALGPGSNDAGPSIAPAAHCVQSFSF